MLSIRYILPEFRQYLTNTTDDSSSSDIICEVGCGYGCTLFPLLKVLSSSTTFFLATDYSTHALDILATHTEYNSDRIHLQKWDVTEPFIDNTYHYKCSTVLSIFALSAVHPDKHLQCLVNIHTMLKPNGHLLFRDYGVYDMTMSRHKHRYGETLFMRQDGTLCYYFSLEVISQLAERSGLFTVVECEYACVGTANRKTGTVMRRVFLHAVLRALPVQSATETCSSNSEVTGVGRDDVCAAVS